MDWLISANSKIYDHYNAFKDYGFIDWRQNYKYKVNDIVYIYVSKPHSKLMYKCIVKKKNMDFNQIRDDKVYWKNISEYNKSLSGKFLRLELIEYVDKESLSLKVLIRNGLKVAPLGAKKLESSLLGYIEQQFDNGVENKNSYDSGNHYVEGLSTKVYVNKYERNKEAREKCIEYHGIKCKVCEFDFEQVYGELGKGYIHVHHIVPISEVNKKYEVDPIKDLIPVCANCHSMLHTKNNKDTYYSIKALKELIWSLRY